MLFRNISIKDINKIENLKANCIINN